MTITLCVGPLRGCERFGHFDPQTQSTYSSVYKLVSVIASNAILGTLSPSHYCEGVQAMMTYTVTEGCTGMGRPGEDISMKPLHYNPRHNQTSSQRIPLVIPFSNLDGDRRF